VGVPHAPECLAPDVVGASPQQKFRRCRGAGETPSRGPVPGDALFSPVTIGWIIALLVLILCIVFAAIGRLDF
jgi:hypothetical protein